MPQAGWSARGLLRPLWNDYEGGREGLAEAVGTSPTSLSSINSGERMLGRNLGKRLAAELGVTLAELGAPAEQADDPESQTLFHRLEKLEARVDEMADKTADSLDRLAGDVRLLLRRTPPADAESQGS